MKLLDKILLATDFSESSENVVKDAIDLAKAFESEITLIHVLPSDIKDEKVRLLLKAAATERLEAINDRFKSEGLKTVKPLIEQGNTCDKILLAGDLINANMILIGAGEKMKNHVFQLGSTAEKLIRKSIKPVWTIKNDSALKIEEILCPVDFSLESKLALKDAVIIARRYNAKLTILSVYQLAYSGSLRLKIEWGKQDKDKRLAHQKEFDAFLEEYTLTDLNWNKKTLEGDPATEILNEISTHETDLLIMGTTGKTGLSRIMMGSVTEKVIRVVPVSFITVKTEDIIELQLDAEIRDIEIHYNIALQLTKDGFLKEAVREFKICLLINDMHFPSLNKIAALYERLGDSESSNKYKNMAKDVLSRIWDKKIEAEVRAFYKF